MKMTCAEVQSHSAEEVVADQSVEVPDGQLHAALLQLQPRDALEDERVVPGRITAASDDRTLVSGRTRTIRQQTADNERTYTDNVFTGQCLLILRFSVFYLAHDKMRSGADLRGGSER